MRISGNENLFPSFPQGHNHGNDHSFPKRREFPRPVLQKNREKT